MIQIPALIDCHVHFRFPGAEQKESWESACEACIEGGITTVFDMPNNTPPIVTMEALLKKQALIEKKGLPLNFKLYLGAHKDHLDEIEKAKDVACGIKVFMGSSTGGLLIDDDLVLEEIFKRASRKKILIAVHAEEEKLLQKSESQDPSSHSKVRPKEAAVVAVKKAIALCKKYETPLFILHVSTKEEIQLIKEAKKAGAWVYAEATPHHLFLNTEDYVHLGNFAKVNPPLREKEDNEALLEGIVDGVIDTIGSDHAPHLREEKGKSYAQAPSGMPGVETLLPLLLNSVHEKKLDLKTVIRLTSEKPREIFHLSPSYDFVTVDLTLTKRVEESELKTRCGWSAFANLTLTGWPISTTIRGKVYPNKKIGNMVTC